MPSKTSSRCANLTRYLVLLRTSPLVTTQHTICDGTAAFPAPKEAALTDIFLGLQKYDVLSALLGSLVVTSFFVSRGQDPFFALGLTAAATVIALVRF